MTDPQPSERVVDLRSNSIPDAFVSGEVGGPDADAVDDRRRAEIGQREFRAPGPRDERFVTNRVADRRLHLVRRRLVAGADLDLHPGFEGRLRVVGDRVARERAVGHDDEVARLGADLRRPPRDLADQAVLAADRHPVADTERFLDLNREARKEIAERVLQRASPRITAPTAVVARIRSCRSSVAASAKSAMMIAS